MKLSNTEKIIYQYLTKADIQKMSADEIAEKLFVSRTSIYRVCLKMGYSSFSQFKYLFLSKAKKIETVDSYAVFNHVNDSQLITILEKLIHSEQIYVFGTHATGMAANYFARQLVNLCYSAIFITDAFELESRLRMFHATDCIVCFSNGGRYTPDIIQLLSDAPIEVIAITKENSPLTIAANYAITFNFPIDKTQAFERENLFNLIVITEKILVNLKNQK